MVETTEQKAATEGVQQKHTELNKASNVEEEEVEIVQNTSVIKQRINSPFINHQKSWDDEDFIKIPEEMQKGIIDNLGFQKPSKI